MISESVISSGQVSLVYHPDSKIVHHEFRQFVFGEQFRTVLMAGVDLLREHGACKWLSDDRGNTSLAREDMDWAATVWAPAAREAGWKYWAVVMPESVIGQMNIQKWTARSRDEGVTAIAFADPAAAMAWLEEQPQKGDPTEAYPEGRLAAEKRGAGAREIPAISGDAVAEDEQAPAIAERLDAPLLRSGPAVANHERRSPVLRQVADGVLIHSRGRKREAVVVVAEIGDFCSA